MSQAFLAREGTLIGTMDASGNCQWVADVSMLPHHERNIVESNRKKSTQPEMVKSQNPSDHHRTQ